MSKAPCIRPETAVTETGEEHLFQDSIFALSSGSLPSGVAVIRVSGPHVRTVLEAVAGIVPAPRRAVLCRFRDADGSAIDRGLAVLFAAPASFTGEDCVEFHLHGGKAVVQAMLQRLAAMDGLRQAEAGEFTRRAFLHGKLDLTGAEALADLIAADTESQRRLALDNAEGGQRDLYDGWRRRLLHARAMIEAELDFADEADVPGSVANRVASDLARLHDDILRHLNGFRAAEIVRDGFRVVLVGAPNAGKSSLLNALARREVAIVTEVAGTTRDLVEASLDIDGVKVVVTDTAGLRETDDKVERIGIARAKEAASRADLVLELTDSGGGDSPDVERIWTAPVLRVATKCDLHQGQSGRFDHRISVVSGRGLTELVAAIGRRAAEATRMNGRVIPTRQRLVGLLDRTREHIGIALELDELELRAEHLRLAGEALGRITGAVDVEELLGVIFAEFCIGK
jgi:tRNA modification GTPase